MRDLASDLKQQLIALVGGDPMPRVMAIVVDKAHARRLFDEAVDLEMIDDSAWTEEKDYKLDPMKKALQDVCTVPLPALGAGDVEELVANWGDDELRFAWAAVCEEKAEEEVEVALREMRLLLLKALPMIDVLRRSDAYLQFPGPGVGSVWGDDAECVAEDGLHFLFRHPPRLTLPALSIPLNKNDPNALRRLAVAEKMIQKTVKSFKLTWAPNTERSELLPREDDDKISRIMIRTYASTDKTLNPLAALCEDDAEFEQWRKMFEYYNEAVKIIRMKPDLIPGKEGYVEQLHADVASLQMNIDAWCGDLKKQGFYCFFGGSKSARRARHVARRRKMVLTRIILENVEM